MSFTNSGQVEYSGSGLIAALNDTVSINIPTSASFVFTITGTWVATLSFQGSVDGSTWFSAVGVAIPTALASTAATSNATYGISVGGYSQVRIIATAYTSGTANIVWNADNNFNSVIARSTITGGTDGTVIGNNTNKLLVDGSTVTQPISGTVAATQSGTWTVQPGNTANTTPWLTTINQGGNSASVTASNALKVDSSAVTQPVSAASLPLPTGAATSANQTTEITSLQLIDDIPSGMNAAFSKGAPIMGQLDDTSTTAATEDNVAPVRITAQRAAHVNLRNNAGTEIATSANPLRTDPTGTTTQPISGTISASQSGTWTVQPGNTANTTPWLTTDSADGPVTPGTVATKSILTGGQFNTALPTLTTAQQAALQVDSSARLIVAPLTNTSIVKAQLQDNAGTAITLGQKPMSSSVPVVVASDQTGIAVKLSDATGNNVTLGQKAMASSLPVVIASDQSTLAISAASLPLPTGAATEATLAKLPLAQGSTTSGQSGVLEQGAVTTSAPTYVTGQTSPLSLTTAGALRVDNSGITQPISSATQFQVVLSNQTLTSSGSQPLTLNCDDNHDVWVIVRINNAPTGTTPTLQFTMSDLDQGSSNIARSTSSGTFTSATTDQTFLHFTTTGKLQLNWTITGTSPSFTGVYVTAIALENSTLRNSSGTEIATSTNPLRTDPTGTTAQPVTDAGGSLTVDGTVTVGNASGASAVNIQDGGNSITVDGTVSVGNTVTIQDGGNTISVDGTVNTSPGFSTSATYSAGIANLVTAATATDFFTITGSATKIIKITALGFSAIGTAGQNVSISLIKRSTANTVGTSTSPASIPLDSTSAAATAVVRAYTANPTLGTTVGTIRSMKLFVSGVVTAGSSGVEIDFAGSSAQPPTLHGTSEVLALNLVGVTVTGASVNAWVEWVEV